VGTERIELTMAADSIIENIIECFNLEKWLETGLKAAIDGEICSFDTILHDGAEIALLPPVSGG